MPTGIGAAGLTPPKGAAPLAARQSRFRGWWLGLATHIRS